MDELTTLGTIFAKKIDFFTRLEQDCARFDEEDIRAGRLVNNPEGETGQQRVKFALHVCREAHEQTERLVADLHKSVNQVSLPSFQRLNWQGKSCC